MKSTKFIKLIITVFGIHLATAFSAESGTNTRTTEEVLDNTEPIMVNARIIGYAPDKFDEQTEYYQDASKGNYSNEFMKSPYKPPADTGRKDPKMGIVLSRDTAEMDSEDFTKFSFLVTPKPLPPGSNVTLTINGNLNLYKQDQQLVTAADLTYTVPETPDTSENWIKKAALQGEAVAWARGKANWGKGGSFKLTVTPPPGKGNAASATLPLVNRRHVVIVTGGSSLNRDYCHATEIEHSPPGVVPKVAKLHLSKYPGSVAAAVSLFDYPIQKNPPLFKSLLGVDLYTMSPNERNFVKQALEKLRIKYRAHDNSHRNFFNFTEELATTLTSQGCEVHVIINQGAATRRNEQNTFAGFSLLGKPVYGACPNFDKGDTIPFVESFSTKYKALTGKGKSNPYKNGEGDLKSEIDGIAKKIKIDDIFYIGHSGYTQIFLEYGSHAAINDAWHIDVGDIRRNGQARSLSPDFYTPVTMAKKADFNQGSEPRLYHLGCFGAATDPNKPEQVSFRDGAIANWGVKVKSCINKTNYAKKLTENFYIPCDDKTVKIIIPDASDPGAGYIW
jgi:hypothetical protein